MGYPSFFELLKSHTPHLDSGGIRTMNGIYIAEDVTLRILKRRQDRDVNTILQ